MARYDVIVLLWCLKNLDETGVHAGGDTGRWAGKGRR